MDAHRLTSKADMLGAMVSIKHAIIKEARRERMREPRRAPSREASSRRDAEAADFIVIGSADSCDISSALKGTVVVYVPPEE